MRGDQNRGVFLISVLFASIMVLMFVGAAFSLAPASLGRATLEARTQRAASAARSGLAWAQSRLRSAPTWLGQGPYSTTQPGLIVSENEGQVVGWVREGDSWSRFRIRFNWQDGPAAPSPVSDGLDDPAARWADFKLVSCNNLAGPVSKDVPTANGSNGDVPSSPLTRLTIPSNSALLSVEGASGPVATDGAGRPTGFSGPTQSRTVEVLLRLNGPGQAVNPSALSAAGDVKVTLGSGVGTLNLTVQGSQTTRLRAKGTLTVSDGSTPNVSSSQGDLRANSLSNITTSGVAGNVTTGVENPTDAMYAIPVSMVKTPVTPSMPRAGVYVMNQAGALTYYDMDFQAYEAARIAGTLSGGVSPATIPGAALSVSAGTPKYTLTFSQDVQVNATTLASDFAIVPDGGTATTNSSLTPASIFAAVDTEMSWNGWGCIGATGSYIWRGGTPAGDNWRIVAEAMTGTTGSVITYSTAGASMRFGPTLAVPAGWSASQQLAFRNDVAQAIATNATALAAYNNVTSIIGYPGGTIDGSVVAPPAPTQLIPSDLEVAFQAPSGGALVVQGTNSGSLIFGSQIQGNGAALVSKNDIQLLGTSSDLSSAPGTALGLNLYAQNNILIDAFKIDSTGAAGFHGVQLQGVVYSWGNVTINTGDNSVPASSWGNITLKGALVAYGGDPASGLPAYTGKGSVTLSGKNAQIQFEPSYLMDLYQNLPTPLGIDVLAWHER